MSNAELIERLDAIANHLEQDLHGNPVETDCNRYRAKSVRAAADALEQLERAKVELALENSKLRARLNRWELKK